MGYEVYITRKEAWFDEEGDAITLDDWLDYVEQDPDMRADGYAEATTPDGSKLRIRSRHCGLDRLLRSCGGRQQGVVHAP